MPPSASLGRSPSVECLASSSAAHRPAAHIALRIRKGLSFELPSEMWGASNLALQLTRTSAASITRVASAWHQPLSTFATPPPPPSGDEPKSIAEALDFRPALSLLQDALCLAAAAGLCAAVYCYTAPATFQLRYAAAMGLLYGVLVAAGRSWLLERQISALQRTERELAALDSKFLPLDGVELHYKARSPRSAWAVQPPPTPATPEPGYGSGGNRGAVAGRHERGGGGGSGSVGPAALRGVHCLHGFGASAYSWSFVQDELAQRLGAVVTAHDMPGFGLTQRPAAPRYYTLAFNGAAARAVMDEELETQRAQQEPDAEPQRVLIGHSMGGAAVAEGVINNPEGIAAIVLVAPAIVALWAGPPPGARGDSMATGLAVVEEVVSAQDAPEEELEVYSSGDSSASSVSSLNSLDKASQEQEGSAGQQQPGGGAGPAAPGSAPAYNHQQHHHHHHGRPHVRHRWPRALRVLAALAQASAFLVVRAVLRLASPAMVLLLRRLVRSRSFWERGLAAAWVDKARVSREYVDAYRCGQLVRGWERGILNFLAGRFAEKLSFWGTLRHVLSKDGHLSQAERLAQVVEQHGIRVLIIHGQEDILVPVANSRRLARTLPGARLVEFERCGHMPQEECAECFADVVCAFLEGQEVGKGW